MFRGWDKVKEENLTKIKLVVGGRPKEVFEDNVDLISFKDLEGPDDDGNYGYTLPINRKLGLRLKANPSTGYKWNYEV